MKHLQKFENFSTKQEELVEEGLFDGIIVNDFKNTLKKLYSRENIDISKEVAKSVYDEVVALKKDGKTSKVVHSSLNRAKRGVKLSTKIGTTDNLYYDGDAKGFGAGLK